MRRLRFDSADHTPAFRTSDPSPPAFRFILSAAQDIVLRKCIASRGDIGPLIKSITWEEMKLWLPPAIVAHVQEQLRRLFARRAAEGAAGPSPKAKGKKTTGPPKERLHFPRREPRSNDAYVRAERTQLERSAQLYDDCAARKPHTKGCVKLRSWQPKLPRGIARRVAVVLRKFATPV